MSTDRGTLSGLTDAPLLGGLAEVRRIAARDDATAVVELDAFAWGMSEAITNARESANGPDDWFGSSLRLFAILPPVHNVDDLVPHPRAEIGQIEDDGHIGQT